MFCVSWRFRSSWTGGGSIQKTDGHYQKKGLRSEERAVFSKKAAPRRAPPFRNPDYLELEPQAELHATRRMCTREMEERRSPGTRRIARCRAHRSAVHRAVDCIELRVVEQ